MDQPSHFDESSVASIKYIGNVNLTKGDSFKMQEQFTITDRPQQ